MNKVFATVVILIVSLFAILPLFHSGFFPMHDNAQVSRVYEMTRAIADGMFPVRWSSDFGFGYGYPVFNFYAPGVYYVGSAIMFLTGSDPLVATKIMMGLGIILAGVFMYLFSRQFWGNWGGIVSGLLYVYAPYHAVDIYVRGDVAEFWAYALVPLVFYGFWKSYCSQKWWHTAVGSIAFAGIILTHNLTAFMLIPFILGLLGYFYFQSRKGRMGDLVAPIKVLLFGILISVFYSLPVLFEIPYTNVLSQTDGGFDFHTHFVCWPQFWYSPWGYGGSAAGCHDGLSFMLGKIHIVLSVIAFVISLVFWKKEKLSKITVVSFLCLVLTLFLTTQLSQPIWESIRLMAFFQFPWRFLLLAAFFMSFTSGFLIFILGKHLFKRKIFLGVFSLILAVSIVYFSVKFFTPKVLYEETAANFTDKVFISWNLSNDAHEYMPRGFAIPKSMSEIPSQTFVLMSPSFKTLKTQERTQLKELIVKADRLGEVHINIAYFPAWNIFVDEKLQKPVITPTGMDVLIPSGMHAVRIVFQQTPVEKLADIISLIGIFLLLADIIKRRRHLFN